MSWCAAGPKGWDNLCRGRQAPVCFAMGSEAPEGQHNPKQEMACEKIVVSALRALGIFEFQVPVVHTTGIGSTSPPGLVT